MFKKGKKTKKRFFLDISFFFDNDLQFLYIHLLPFNIDTNYHTNLWIRPFSVRVGTHLSRSNELLSDIRFTHPDLEPLHNCLLLFFYIYELRGARVGPHGWIPFFFGNLENMSLIIIFHLKKIREYVE